MPPVAITTWLVAQVAGHAGRPRARRRRARPRQQAAGVHAFQHGDRGQARTAATTARMISRPVASPLAWTMRRRPCAASRPSAARRRRPVEAGAERDERRRSRRAGADDARATAGSHSPSPAASVSARCSAGLSSGPTAAATPPCAQALDASSPSGARRQHQHGLRRQLQRRHQPGEAGADDDRAATAAAALIGPPASARPRGARGRPRRVDRAPRASSSPARGGCWPA